MALLLGPHTRLLCLRRLAVAPPLFLLSVTDVLMVLKQGFLQLLKEEPASADPVFPLGPALLTANYETPRKVHNHHAAVCLVDFLASFPAPFYALLYHVFHVGAKFRKFSSPHTTIQQAFSSPAAQEVRCLTGLERSLGTRQVTCFLRILRRV